NELVARTLMQLGTSFAVSQEFDWLGRVVAEHDSTDGAATADQSFTYSPDGLLTGINQSGYAGAIASYALTYDGLDELTAENGLTFAYDTAGQLKSETSHTYAFDAAGNRTGDGTEVTTGNELSKSEEIVDDGIGGSTTVTWSYDYDAEGNITKKYDENRTWSY